MMKKFVVLMLVLGIAAYANAAIINVVGEHQDLNQNGLVDASEMVILTITTQANVAMYEIDVHVTGPGTLVEVNGGPNSTDPLNHTLMGLWYYTGIASNGIVKMADGGVTGYVTGRMIGGLAIHCDGPGDVLVQLTTGGALYTELADGTEVTQADMGSIIIHQIPEPITMGLLGLGSSFVVRRKKA